jgi:predicted secreted hydrolase
LLSENQLGWNWFSLHLNNGQKIMLFKIRQNDGNDFFSGSWINQDGTKRSLNANTVQLEETAYSTVRGRKIPTKWKISILWEKTRIINIEALNNYSWMETSVPYWEGPISISGDLSGVGYLEMTGY